MKSVCSKHQLQEQQMKNVLLSRNDPQIMDKNICLPYVKGLICPEHSFRFRNILSINYNNSLVYIPNQKHQWIFSHSHAIPIINSRV